MTALILLPEMNPVLPASAPMIRVLGHNGAIDTNWAESVRVDMTNNIYLGGRSLIFSAANSWEMATVKLSPAGSIQWENLFGDGTQQDVAYDMQIDQITGDIYSVGQTANFYDGGTPQRPLVAKYDNDGVLQWQKTILTAFGSAAFAVGIDSSSDVYVGLPGLLVKLNPAGAIQWQVTLTGTVSDQWYDIHVDASDNIYVTGASADLADVAGLGVMVAKYNSSGTLLWHKKLNGTAAGQDQGRGVTVDSSGNVFVCGNHASAGGFGGTDVFLAKWDSSGTLQWQKTFGSASTEVGYDIEADASGDIYVTGSAVSSAFVLKLDTNGGILWQNTLGTVSSNEVGYGLTLDATGTQVIISGQTTGNPATTNNPQILLARLPGDGTGLGTYSGFVYAASSFGIQNLSFVESAPMSTGTGSTTIQDRTLIEPASSMVNTVIVG